MGKRKKKKDDFFEGEGAPVKHTAKVPRPHISQEFREKGVSDLADEAVRGLRSYYKECALGHRVHPGTPR